MVFIEMGGNVENLEVKFFIDDVDSLTRDIGAFDPRNAWCFTEDDTERLREVIDATGQGRVTQL